MQVQLVDRHDKAKISECFIEEDVSYNGNDMNDGVANVQPDVASCRESCRPVGAKYFGFNYGGNRACYCKSSNSGRIPRSGVTSGNTMCPG